MRARSHRDSICVLCVEGPLFRIFNMIDYGPIDQNIRLAEFGGEQNLLQTVHDLNLLMKSFEAKLFQQKSCCVCGLASCRESTDHQFISLKDFKLMLQNGKVCNPQLDELKEKTRKFYKSLKEEIVAVLESDHAKMQEHLNRFYYMHISPQKINMAELCQFANSKFSSLPNKKILRLINELKERRNLPDPIDANLEFQQLNQDITTFISDFQKKKEIDKFKDHLPYVSLVERVMPKLKLRRSQSQISNPEEIDEEAAKTYTWKNVTIRSKTKLLELSNKNITDCELLRQMPIISSFKNIKDFQIRHNKITSLSCKVIASNMTHIKSLDIRGNPVGDEGILIIIRGLPQLKSFMISQTNCTNVAARAIVSGLQDIEMLWCQHNRVDGQHAIMVGSLSKLKVLSFAGNGLDAETGDRLRKIFNSKGYVVV